MAFEKKLAKQQDGVTNIEADINIDPYQKNEFTDACIKVGSRYFYMSKHQICSHSDVFREIFKDTNEIEINDTTTEEIQMLLDVIIPFERKEITYNNWQTIFSLSFKYDMKQIHEKCKKFMLSDKEFYVVCTTLDNMWQLFKTDHKFSLEFIKRLILKKDIINYETIRDEDLKKTLFIEMDIHRRYILNKRERVKRIIAENKLSTKNRQQNGWLW